MVLLSLQCTIVGQVGRSFDVEIDDGAKVSTLKDVIKGKNTNDLKDIDADKLQLFLAKKGDAWLTEAAVKNGVTDTDGLTLLDPPGAPLNMVGLSVEAVQFVVTMEHIKDKTTPVNVLVKLPSGMEITIKETDNQEYTEELEYYQRSGNEIQRNCQDCAAILDKIDYIYERERRPKPFICVEGSSGMGKSQLAFALGGEGRSQPRPWFYWPASAVDSTGLQKF